MKRILSYIGFAILLAVIPFSVMRGEDITHNFDEMYDASPKRLVVASGNKSATTTTDDLTYTVSGGSLTRFWLDLHNREGSKVISINLPSKYDYVTIYSPTDAVAQVYFRYYYPADPSSDDIKVYASADDSSYSDVSATGGSRGIINANIPIGSQYIKIVNKGNTGISIYYIQYTLQTCNCFRYVPE